MSILEAIILAIIEGITEFLPISSTGHMVIASAFMGIADDNFTKLFEVCIQFGAILSVVVLYHKRFFDFQKLDFYLKLFVAFLPAAVIGLLLNDYIDALLSNVIVVATSLLIGGIILVFIDRQFKNSYETDQNLSYLKCLIIGMFQTISMIPGVSRSAATIIGGQFQGLSRKSAAEFSFFLAVPTMFAATAYKLLKGYEYINSDNISVLLIGNVVAFFVAMAAIKFFIGFLAKYGFRFFGYYRIILGVVILSLYALGIDLKVD